MRLRRLGWAGVEIETAGGTLVIDPLENASPLAPHVGEAREPPSTARLRAGGQPRGRLRRRRGGRRGGGRGAGPWRRLRAERLGPSDERIVGAVPKPGHKTVLAIYAPEQGPRSPLVQETLEAMAEDFLGVAHMPVDRASFLDRLARETDRVSERTAFQPETLTGYVLTGLQPFDFARADQKAIEAALKSPETRTKDLGGSAGTKEFTQAIVSNLESVAAR
jgi:hypothetical protein